MADPVFPADGRVRAVVEGVTPCVDAGRFAAKCVRGERFVVEADCFADGHDLVACVLRWWREGESNVEEVPMRALGNDRWRASFRVETIGRYRYTVVAWVDHFLSWRHDFARRVDREDLQIAALVGADLVLGASARARGEDRRRPRNLNAGLSHRSFVIVSPDETGVNPPTR